MENNRNNLENKQQKIAVTSNKRECLIQKERTIKALKTDSQL